MRELARAIDPATAVVIVVDVQNDFCHPAGALAAAGAPTADALAMLPTLQRFLDAARAAGTRIVFLQTIHEDATDSDAWRGRGLNQSAPICRNGTWGIEFIGVAPRDDEPVVVKHRYSGFLNTRLDSVLRTMRAETLIMTGVSTNVCVETTARHGFMLDYHIVMVDDCCAAYGRDEHEGALYNVRTHIGTIASSATIVDAWSSRETPVAALTERA
jgi:ureidoacrylate peracid hydrolase